MWTKRCFSISYFLSVMYSSQFWQKSVDRWTNNENYEKKNQSLLSYCLKVQTCGQVVVILFYFFFLPHFSFLLCTLHNFDKKVWTGGPVMKIMKKSYNLFYFHFWKCGHLWMKLSFISYFLSFFFVPFIFFAKKCGQVDK